jgi:hypothetical protein
MGVNNGGTVAVFFDGIPQSGMNGRNITVVKGSRLGSEGISGARIEGISGIGAIS